jgi:DNA-directed RNA polymerase subunit K/omega
MSRYNKPHVQNLNPSCHSRNLQDIQAISGNIYLSMNIISKRAQQINAELMSELADKLEEFRIPTDNLEEISENREQIEISRFYEKLPHPTVIATDEFMNNKVAYRSRETPGAK